MAGSVRTAIRMAQATGVVEGMPGDSENTWQRGQIYSGAGAAPGKSGKAGSLFIESPGGGIQRVYLLL